MAKYHGAIGFAQSVETAPGMVEEIITERLYFGDVIRNNRRYNSGDAINGQLSISNQLSIVSDPYLRANFHTIRYATYLGTKWKIGNVEVQYPRLILELSEVYNA